MSKRSFGWCGLGLAVLFILPVDVGAQEGSIEDAIKLNQESIRLSRQGRYEEAISLAQRAITIREKTLGPDHPETATSLNNLAAMYNATGAYAKAEPLYRRALAIRERTLGPDHPDTADSLNGLALLYDNTGAYAKAEPLYQRALAIRERTLGPDHRDTADSLNNLASFYSVTGAYAKAEPLYQRALAIYENALGPDHPNTATVVNNLAALYDATAAYSKAEPLYQRALAIRERTLGPDHPDTANSLNNLAWLYRTIGAYAKAEPLYQRAVKITEKSLGPEHPNTVTAVHNLAALYDATGAYAKAEPLYQRTLAIRERTLGPDHPDTANSLNNLASLYETTGAYAKAEPLYRRALAIYENALGLEHPGTANLINNLAALYSATGAYGKAEPLYQRTLAIRERTLGPDHPDTATSLNNLASLYETTGAYAKAEPLYRRALAIYEKALGPEHLGTASLLNNLAELYFVTGDYAKAGPLWQRALAIREKALGPDHPDTALSLKSIAVLSWATAKPAQATSLLERAQIIQENNARRFLLSGSEARKQAYMQKLRGNTYISISFSLTVRQQATALGLTSILQYKGRVLDAMSDIMARLRQSVKAEDSELFEQFTEVAQQLSTLTFQGPGNRPPEVYRERLEELSEQQEQLETELSNRSAAFSQEVSPITLAVVQEAIPRDAVLLECFRYQPFDPKGKDEKTKWGKPRYVLYVLKRDGEPIVADLGEAEGIETLVLDFRKVLSDPKSTFVKEVAKELSEKLLRPLRSHLGNTERLLISPDGALNLLPFAALVDEKGEYMAKRFEITYLTSGRDLLRLGSELGSRSSPVVVADPDYGDVSTTALANSDVTMQPQRSIELDRSGVVFKRLPGTVEEVKVIKDLLKLNDQNVLTGPNATESKVKQLHGPRILHIATHGFFLSDKEITAVALGKESFLRDQSPIPFGENPLLRSGLALAGANQRRSGTDDDGILTAAEAAQLDLRGTELVVLSACDTGIGNVKNGEGVYGLRRALVLAGAQTQVTSLWKVEDAATKDLMLDYYKRLLNGLGRSAALRDAQRTMINSQKRSHPYFWAAFVSIGNWAPLAPAQ